MTGRMNNPLSPFFGREAWGCKRWSDLLRITKRDGGIGRTRLGSPDSQTGALSTLDGEEAVELIYAVRPVVRDSVESRIICQFQGHSLTFTTSCGFWKTTGLDSSWSTASLAMREPIPKIIFHQPLLSFSHAPLQPLPDATCFDNITAFALGGKN